MANPTVLEKKSKEVKVLSDANRELLEAIEHNNQRRRFWASVAFGAVMIAIGLGIFYQFELATKNTKHIDCVVKLFTTPLPANARSRTISNPSTTCNINFSK